MIVPYPVELKELHKIPLTMTLIFLNIVLFLLYFSGGEQSRLYSSSLLNMDGLTLTGRVYQQYLSQQNAEQLKDKPRWIFELKPEDSSQLGLLGGYALRDGDFLKASEELKVSGDEVAVARWKEQIRQYKDNAEKHSFFKFGLSSQSQGPLAWLTYQFSHSNWVHLLSNLIYLVFIGAAVEIVAGSGALLLVYVLGGIAGGMAFLAADPSSMTPVVGASACVSALLAFYCLVEPRRRVRYFYFVFPRKDLFGPIYLPTLLIIPLFLVIDLANLLSSPAGLMGGVAYTAHLGGTALGLCLGLFYRFRRHQSGTSLEQSPL